MIQCSLQRYTAWPGAPTTMKKVGQFRVDYTALLEELVAELELLKATGVELAMDIPDGKLKASRRTYDGWPKSDAVTVRQGVILNFDHRTGPKQFACDTYTDWKDNLRAISLTLTALRAMRRYGASQGDQQYRGYDRQIAPPPAPPRESEVRQAIMVLWAAGKTGEPCTGEIVLHILSQKDLARALIRESLARTHPDSPDGSQRRFVEANAAAEILRKHHGGPD